MRRSLCLRDTFRGANGTLVFAIWGRDSQNLSLGPQLVSRLVPFAARRETYLGWLAYLRTLHLNSHDLSVRVQDNLSLPACRSRIKILLCSICQDRISVAAFRRSGRATCDSILVVDLLRIEISLASGYEISRRIEFSVSKGCLAIESRVVPQTIDGVGVLV